jgi:hypothetical protein
VLGTLRIALENEPGSLRDMLEPVDKAGPPNFAQAWDSLPADVNADRQVRFPHRAGAKKCRIAFCATTKQPRMACTGKVTRGLVILEVNMDRGMCCVDMAHAVRVFFARSQQQRRWTGEMQAYSACIFSCLDRHDRVLGRVEPVASIVR